MNAQYPKITLPCGSDIYPTYPLKIHEDKDYDRSAIVGFRDWDDITYLENELSKKDFGKKAHFLHLCLLTKEDGQITCKIGERLNSKISVARFHENLIKLQKVETPLLVDHMFYYNDIPLLQACEDISEELKKKIWNIMKHEMQQLQHIYITADENITIFQDSHIQFTYKNQLYCIGLVFEDKDLGQSVPLSVFNQRTADKCPLDTACMVKPSKESEYYISDEEIVDGVTEDYDSIPDPAIEEAAVTESELNDIIGRRKALLKIKEDLKYQGTYKVGNMPDFDMDFPTACSFASSLCQIFQFDEQQYCRSIAIETGRQYKANNKTEHTFYIRVMVYQKLSKILHNKMSESKGAVTLQNIEQTKNYLENYIQALLDRAD